MPQQALGVEGKVAKIGNPEISRSAKMRFSKISPREIYELRHRRFCIYCKPGRGLPETIFAQAVGVTTDLYKWPQNSKNRILNRASKNLGFVPSQIVLYVVPFGGVYQRPPSPGAVGDKGKVSKIGNPEVQKNAIFEMSS